MRDLELFARAMEIADLRSRREFLRGACNGDQALFEAVERLLAAHDDDDGQLDKSPIPPDLLLYAWNDPVRPKGDTSLVQAGDEALGSSTACWSPPDFLALIGPYRLLEKIGEGGFGHVFVAEQESPIRRRVAVKVIKPGMDSKEVIARFSAERQALALMDHPNIARVLDGGTTDRGLPYFVMELVRGVPITHYCNRVKLNLVGRLKLFVDACKAIQHSHQKGIIHRDIKPSNVMVTLQDGEPVVKIIDFGVAKALNQRLTDMTVYTRFSFMIGTPAYMSPEQAELSAFDVDTRSDIYSLGVLLYELVTGSPPFQPARFATATMDEMRRIIRDEEPPRPSMRISTLGPAASSIAQLRGIEPSRLQSLVRGDLDWIAMKALAKDRGQRYETANGLAADVKRFLDGDTVTARPPSWSYQTSRFVHRNKGLVVSAAIVLAMVILGSIISVSLAIWALREQEIAHEQEGLAVQKSVEASEARERAQKAEMAAIGNLLLSRMAFTDLNLKSRRMGQQWKSLDAIRESIDLAGKTGKLSEHRIALRSQVISALARVDVKPARSIPVPVEANRFFSFTADFSRVAWRVRDDGTNYITIRQVEDPNKELMRVRYPFDTQTSYHDEVICRLSADGRFLTMASGQHGILLWDLARNQLIREMRAFYVIGGQAFSADSRWLAVVERAPDGAHDHVNIFHLPSGDLHRTIPMPQSRQVAFSWDSRRIVVGGTDQLWICEVESGTRIAEIRRSFGGWGPALAWSPSGELIAVSNANQIEMWHVSDLVKGKQADSRRTPGTVPTPFCTLSGHESLVDTVLFHPRHEHLLISSSWDNTTRFWNVFSGFEQMMVPQSRPCISEDGAKIALTAATSAEVYEFLSGDACRWIWRGNAQQLVFDPQMAWLAVGTNRGTRFWSVPSLAPIGSIGEKEAYGLAWDESRSGLLAGSSLGLFEIPVDRSEESSLCLGPSRQLLTTSHSNFGHVSCSSDGRWVLGGELEDWSPILLDRSGGDVLRMHRSSRTQATRISPNGQWLSQHAGDKVYVRDLLTGQDQNHVDALPSSTGMTFSPDSQRLLISSNQGTRFVSLADPRDEHWLDRARRIFSVPFAHRQEMLVLPKGPGELELLDGDQQAGICDLQYPDPPRLFAFASFSQDDSLLAVTHETSAAVWDMRLVRNQLADFGLDWERPTTAGPVATATVKQLDVTSGDLEILQSFSEQVDSVSKREVAGIAERLIQSGVTLPLLYYSLGWSLESLGDYAAAVDDMRRALDAAPYCETWRKDLANCLMESFRFEEAWEAYWPMADPRKSHSAQFAFQQLCYICATRPQTVPNQAEFRTLLGLWLAALDQHDQSSHFGLLVAGLNDDTKRTLWEAVGMALFGLGENSRSLEILKKNARPGGDGGNSVLAVLYSAQGDIEQAERCLKEAESFPRKNTIFDLTRLHLLFYEPLQVIARKQVQELRLARNGNKDGLPDSQFTQDPVELRTGRFDSVDIARVASVDYGRVFVSAANDKPELTEAVEGNLVWWELNHPESRIRFDLAVPGPGKYELSARLVGSHYCGIFQIDGQADEAVKEVDLYRIRKTDGVPALTLIEDFALGTFEAVEAEADLDADRPGSKPDLPIWIVTVVFRATGKHEKSLQHSLLIDEITWARE